MQLVTMKCPACAASVNFDNDKATFKCEYCQNQISIIKPIAVNNIVPGLNESEQSKYTNYISILEQSMKAGNYVEAYNYCNKALEVNPKSGQVWENKAICSYWLSTLDNLTNDKANEIITYLNASKQNDPDSKTYIETAVSISDNLFTIAQYKANLNVPMININGKYDFSIEGLKQLFQCIEIMDLCYQIYPRIEYLKKSVDMITNGRIKWVKLSGQVILNSTEASRIGFDARKKREILIKQINNIEPSYVPPDIYKIKSNIKTILIVIAIFILLMIINIIFNK